MEKLKKIEKFIGSAKFAVIIIVIFAIALTYGTFMESYHGVQYANRLVYKSPSFIFLQFLMFLSIFISTLLRMPLKKHLYGFYVIHLGLLTIFCGSFVTYHAGIDGSMPLPPNTPARHIDIDEDQLVIVKEGKEEVSVPLPFIAHRKEMDFKITDEYKLIEYMPFADEVITWKENTTPAQFQTSAQYLLANKMFNEKLTFSLHQQADFQSSSRLGPLSVNYLPTGFAKCFGTQQSDFLLWDSMRQTCIENVTWEKKKTPAGTEIVRAKGSNLLEVFVPKLGPIPVFIENDQLKPKNLSPFRLFARDQFKEKPHLFLFGKSVSYYDQDNETWTLKEFSNDKIDLPWMGFQIKLLKYAYDKFPVLEPSSIIPTQDNGELVTGKVKAAKVRLNSNGIIQDIWVKDNKPLQVTLGGQKYFVRLAKKRIQLPFQITLDNFKMDTDPGTRNPASYESFITLFKNGVSENHHIFMNNPLKYLGLTFYQASYFQTQSGDFGSVLSINYDPGRFWKYLGSLLLVLGSLWHFVLRRKLVSLKGNK